MLTRNTSRLRFGVLAFAAALAVQSAFAAQPVHLDRKGEQWAAKTLHRMTIEEKVGQMIMVWAKVRFLNARSPEYLELQEQMRRYHVGGFGVTVPVEGGQLVESEPLEAAALTNRLQRDSKYPLLLAADFERGLSMRLIGATPFPAAMAFGAAGNTQLAREFGRISAEESRAIGIQWNWFPVADVNSNPDNPIIDTRSFGEDPAQVSAMVTAYIEGAHQGGLLTTVKHFPGHGDTDTDSHLALARVTASRERLNAVELVPFCAAIAANVDSVMVGHLIVPSIEPDPNRPASISSHVITGLLQQELGFHGLVVTDALDMNGLKQVFSGSEAEIAGAEAVAAVRAGNDMVIIPGSLEGAYNGLLRAVKSGEISRQRLDESVLKILRMKASVGLHRNRFVDLAAVPEAIARPDSLAVATETAQRAITLVRDNAKLLPMPAAASAEADAHPSATVAVIFTDHARVTESGRAFSSELRKHAPGARLFYVDASTADALRSDVLAAVQSVSRVIAVAEAMPNPRRTTQGRDNGSAGLDSSSLELLKSIVASAPQKTVVAALGNPYTGGSIAGVETYLCTFSDTPLSASTLADALFGQTAIHGRLPVSIPGMASRGTGLDRAAAEVSGAAK